MTPETSIYEFAKQGLALSAEKTAIWFYGRNLTYRELFQRIDNVADNLYALGVRQGTVITIHLPNCPQAVMAIYAVAKLGGICNMVHPQIPVDMLRSKMELTESKFLITGNHFPECANIWFTEKLIFVDIAAHMGFLAKIKYRNGNRNKRPTKAVCFESMERPASVCADYLPQQALAETCVMYLHSSGTAGEPKTVMHCHKAINREAIGISEGCSLGDVSNDVLLNVMPIYHGIGLVDDMHSAISGGTKIVQLASWNAKYAARMIRKHQISIMTVVPKIHYDLAKQKGLSLDSFRLMFSGGESIDTSFKKRLYERTGKHIYEGYGLTELVAPCGVELHDGTNKGYTPFPGNEFAVYSQDGQFSNYGEGELIVFSETAMMGYYKDDNATQKAFVMWNGKKWLRTGDYGIVDSRGNFTFKERVKYIIIQNGNNVFPGEIEETIMQSGLVRDVCVVGIWNEQNHTQNICAYAVPANRTTLDIETQVIEYCKTKLPGYSLPKHVCVVEQIPRNTTGKADRKRLEQK